LRLVQDVSKPRNQLSQVNHREAFSLGVVFGPFTTGTPHSPPGRLAPRQQHLKPDRQLEVSI